MVIQKQKDEKTKWILAFLIFLTVVLGTYVRFFPLIGFVIFVYIIVFCDSKDALFMIVFSVSFANIFKISPSSQSLFTYIMLGYVVYRLVMGQSCSNAYWLTFFLFICFLGVQSLMSVNVLGTIKFVANFLFLYFALHDAHGYEKEIFSAYIGGVVCSSTAACFGVLNNLDRYFEKDYVVAGEVAKVRFSGIYSDANYYCVNVIIALCLVIILYYKKEINNPVFISTVSLLFLYAILTYSKSAFLMLTIPVLLFLYTNSKSRRYFLQIGCLIGLLVFVVYLLLGKIDFLSTVLSRFQNAENLTQLTTGRTRIWGNYLRHFFESPFHFLVGNGLGAKYIGGKAAHNTYIDLVHYLGIIGSFLMIRLLHVASMDFRYVRYRRNILNYSVMMVVLIMYTFLSELLYFDLPFHFLLMIMVLNELL